MDLICIWSTIIRLKFNITSLAEQRVKLMITQLLIMKMLSGNYVNGLAVFIEKIDPNLSVPILQPDHFPIQSALLFDVLPPLVG